MLKFSKTKLISILTLKFKSTFCSPIETCFFIKRIFSIIYHYLKCYIMLNNFIDKQQKSFFNTFNFYQIIFHSLF